MKVSTANRSKDDYEVIDTVFAYGSSSESFWKNVDLLEAYPKVKEVLAQNAEELGADMVIGARFDYRVATEKSWGMDKKVFEVFAYGTAIKLKK